MTLCQLSTVVKIVIAVVVSKYYLSLPILLPVSKTRQNRQAGSRMKFIEMKGTKRRIINNKSFLKFKKIGANKFIFLKTCAFKCTFHVPITNNSLYINVKGTMTIKSIISLLSLFELNWGYIINTRYETWHKRTKGEVILCIRTDNNMH